MSKNNWLGDSDCQEGAKVIQGSVGIRHHEEEIRHPAGCHGTVVLATAHWSNGRNEDLSAIY